MSKKVQNILGEYLFSNQLLSRDAWERLLKEFLTQQEDFVCFLDSRGIMQERDALNVLSQRLNIPFVHLSDTAVEKTVIERVPIRIASYYRFLPLEIRDRTLVIAVSCPFDIQMLDEIRTHLGFSLEMVLAPRQEIDEALKRAYGLGAQTMEQMASASKEKSSVQVKERADKVENIEELAGDASVIRLVNEIILEAHQKRATDIHIEPSRDDVTIRYRVDGVLYDVKASPEVKNFFAPIISRIKIMSNLDIVERRMPQDGRAIVKTQEQNLDLRVSTLPTPYGESVVIRILPTKILYSLQKLGLSEKYRLMLEELIEKPHGIIFVTGPTGSGKTTTLYACLNKINTRDRKIITLEDPIEYEMEGMTQIQVQPEIGLDFARGLRSVLRHDPDIIMVGEVRDLETAEIAIRVALTGHLIFSTLHTNDAASGVTRLIDIGIEPYLVASSVEAFIAQRLVRVVCPSCRYVDQAYPFTLREKIVKELGLKSFDEVKIYRAKGCPKCNKTGFFGRTAIYEMLVVDEKIQELIIQRAPSGEIKKAAKAKGMKTLFQDGLRKVIEGITTPEEVLRVVASEGDIFEGTTKDFMAAPSVQNDERRKFDRLDASVNLHYKQARAADGSQDASVSAERFTISDNISASGLAFRASEEVAVDTILDLQIDLPDKGKPIKCLGKVIRVKAVEAGLYDIGICFLDLTGAERARLDRYVIKSLEG